MMNELIDQASAKGTALDLPKQCKQLREGIGGKRKFTRRPFGQERNRLNLEEAQNKQLNNKLKLDKNTANLDKFKEKLPKTLDTQEVDLQNSLPKDVEKIGKFTTKNNKLSLIDKQSNRRIDNAAADHVIGNAFLEHVRNPKPIDPSKLKNLEQQFTDLKAAVKERDKLTKGLEKEESRQLKNSNKILSAEFKLQAEKNKLNLATENTPEYVKQNSKVERQRLENKKLERRQLENALRDEKRLNNAASMHDRANNLMRTMLDPNMTDEDKAAARKEFEGLKQEVKDAKKREKELAPAAAVNTRATFRNNLEKAEAQEIRLNRRADLLALKEDNEKNRGKTEKVKSKQAQVERRRSDSELMYNFANGLLQERQQGAQPELSVKDFNKQFKNLKTADKLLTEQRKKSGPEESQGYAMMKQLITEQFASESPNTKQLATDCKNLRNGIRGTDRLERKMQKLATRSEKDPKNLNKQRRAEDSGNDLILGQKLIAAAMASDHKSDALANLKDQFKALKTAIKERNKFAKNIEKLEKQSKKSEKRDARAIQRAEKQQASIERKQGRAKKRLQRRQERLNKLDPDKDAKKIERLNARIERQHGRVDKLAEKHINQEAKIENLKLQEQENRRAYETRIEAAKDRHQRANNALEGLVASGNADKKAAKNAFAGLRDEIKVDVTQEKARKEKQKADAKSTLQATAQASSATTVANADARKAAAPAPIPQPAAVAAQVVPAPAAVPAQPQPAPAQPAVPQPQPAPAPTQPRPEPVLPPAPQPAAQPAARPPVPAKFVLPPQPEAPEVDKKSIRVDRAGLLTSETAMKQALKAAQGLDGCKLIDSGSGKYTVQNNNGVTLGAISLQKTGNEMTLTATSSPGNAADKNEQFFKVAAVVSANMTPSKPKVEVQPTVTVGAKVEKGEDQKGKALSAFNTANEEHKNSLKVKFKDLRDSAREKITGEKREDRAERKSQSRPGQ